MSVYSRRVENISKFCLSTDFKVRLVLHQNCSITILLPMAFTFTSSPMENWRSLQFICKLYFIWVLEKYCTYKHNWRSILCLGISKQLLYKVCLLSQLLYDFYVASFACDGSRYQYVCAMVSGRQLRLSFDMESCENLLNCHLIL